MGLRRRRASGRCCRMRGYDRSMASRLHFVRSDGSAVEVAWTDTSDGDFHIDAAPDALSERRARVMDGHWAVVRQVHGNAVAEAGDVLAADTAPEADGVITATVGQPISVQGADCAPIAFITDTGPIGVAHAGWRGLANGIISEVHEQLNGQDATIEHVVVGPVICTNCYEFGASDLDQVAAELGDVVRATTPEGTPALDMRAGIIAAFDDIDVTNVDFVGGCPSCDNTGFSHRARTDPQRHCLVARLIDDEASGEGAP